MPDPLPSPDARKIYRVAELAMRIKAVLEGDLGTIWVEGEVSGFKQVSSGHMYFDLKDESALINCCLFRGSQRGLRAVPASGQKVRVLGDVTSYPPRSTYQLIVRQVEPAGLGDLQAAFEQLKARLAAEGLFEPARKRPLPLLPRHIGIVTSPTGAAIRDMLQILGRRFPNLHVLLAPVRVQGEGAAAEIAAAIDLLNERTDLEVLIVGRGGGSLEDLWAFNEEPVARAIARSRLPVISAVGHETDFTISDFVADVRAPTPSAAAELVVRPKADFEQQVDTLRRHLAAALRQRALALRARFTRAAGSYVFREPQNLLERHRQAVAHLHERARRALLDALRDRQQRLDEAALLLGQHTKMILQRRRQAIPLLQARLAATLPRSADRAARRVQQAALRLPHPLLMAVQRARQTVARHAAQLQALSPLAVLDRGYSITQTAAGAIVRDAERVRPGDGLVTRVARGRIASTVQSIERNPDHGNTEDHQDR